MLEHLEEKIAEGEAMVEKWRNELPDSKQMARWYKEVEVLLVESSDESLHICHEAFIDRNDGLVTKSIEPLSEALTLLRLAVSDLKQKQQLEEISSSTRQTQRLILRLLLLVTACAMALVYFMMNNLN